MGMEDGKVGDRRWEGWRLRMGGLEIEDFRIGDRGWEGWGWRMGGLGWRVGGLGKEERKTLGDL